MNKMIESALLSNHATLGVHWIYDHEYIKKLSDTRSILFMKQDKSIFDKAKTSFFVYENNQYSVQGEILKWLYEALEDNPLLSAKDFDDILYKQFKPGGYYQGYVEKYGKLQVFNRLIDELNLSMDKQVINDQQMVAFVPYIVFKALGRDFSDAMDFVKIYSNDPIYEEFFKMFDLLFDYLKVFTLQEALEKAITECPNHFELAFKKALEVKDTDEFIEKYAGRACPYKHALPVIVHLLYHYSSYEDVTMANALIGGASADRGLLLGAILSEVYRIPEKWL
ncbi:MAG: hypothetical protein AB7E09_00250 [Candidatus Izemoplasmatales bacterium]